MAEGVETIDVVKLEMKLHKSSARKSQGGSMHMSSKSRAVSFYLWAPLTHSPPHPITMCHTLPSLISDKLLNCAVSFCCFSAVISAPRRLCLHNLKTQYVRFPLLEVTPTSNSIPRHHYLVHLGSRRNHIFFGSS